MEERKCPVCHKVFIVPSKSKWAYKKMSQLICSWTCLRALEMKKGEDKGMRAKVPEEVKQESIQVAIAGGNPIETLEPYTRNPKAMWWAIKAKVKETDPEGTGHERRDALLLGRGRGVGADAEKRSRRGRRREKRKQGRRIRPRKGGGRAEEQDPLLHRRHDHEGDERMKKPAHAEFRFQMNNPLSGMQ